MQGNRDKIRDGTAHFFVAEPDERLGGEPPVELLRRGEAEKVADLLLSAG
ncbi:MAG: hypothetical protein H0U55_17015 [Rubrobacteraceae bacterium]|nr:hypothetical protein [Rubrobacteraceae bacterium]